jgi:hypothetical protein
MDCFYSILIELSPFNNTLNINFNFSFSNEIYNEHDSHLKYAQNMNTRCISHASHVYIDYIISYMGVHKNV